MRLNEDDLFRLIRAVQLYKDQASSEWMWEKYDDLQNKLRVYLDQYSTNDG